MSDLENLRVKVDHGQEKGEGLTNLCIQSRTLDGKVPNNYIICSTQRSGSSFFCDCLSKTGALGVPTEWLVFLEAEDRRLGEKERALKCLPLKDIIAARAAGQKSMGHGSVIGWKIMWSTMAQMQARLDREQGEVLDGAFFEREFEQPKFIHYERQNKIAQAVSHAILVKLNVSHIHDNEEVASLNAQKEKLTITDDEISFFLKKLISEERKWEKFFEANDIEPLRIIYEDFCSDVCGHIVQLADFLDVKIDEAAIRNVHKKVVMKKTRSIYEKKLAEKYLASFVGL